MLIVLIIFILLPSIFTFAVSHISANKLQYLRYQIKQVSYVVCVFVTNAFEMNMLVMGKFTTYRQRTNDLCNHVRPSIKHPIPSHPISSHHITHNNISIYTCGEVTE